MYTAPQWMSGLDGIGNFEGNSVSVSVSVYWRGRGQGREAVAGRALRQHGVHLLVLVVWRAVEGESGCSAVSIFAVDADNDVGMGSALRPRCGSGGSRGVSP
ncbi:hypothetical protein C8F04DRAFT_1240759 [Mycena alexandri]|uniref:Uncharacterized protein n=1 Tax=Mycena alexandri TaxID=1745969 RepID=A0AAD6S7F8_9AGAR|nr:hypothetical protein C8F04DRAFT_1240759 [Mycena alexandri]